MKGVLPIAGPPKNSHLTHWPQVKLGDVAIDLTVGYVGPMASEYVKSGVPFLRSQNIEPFRVNFNDLKFITQEFHVRIKKSALSPGDVVIVRTGKPGTAAVIPKTLPVSNCSDLVIVRPGPNIDPRFLAYFVNSVATHHVASHLVGAVQQHFNVASARTIQLHLPPIKEQRSIAHILGTLDDKIELNRHMNETLEATARTIFKSWFVDFDPVKAKTAGGRPAGMDSATAELFPNSFDDSALGEIPKGWRVGTLGDVAENLRRNILPGQIRPNTPYIALEHMPRQCVALSDWSTATDVGSNKFEFKAGEILFGKLRPYFHKVGVAPIDGVCSTDIVVVAPKGPAWFGFVLGHISSKAFVSYTSAGSTGTKMPRTSWNEMMRYTLAIPPESVAKAFTEQARPMINELCAGTHESHSLTSIRDALLPKLLSGDVSLPNPRFAK